MGFSKSLGWICKRSAVRTTCFLKVREFSELQKPVLIEKVKIVIAPSIIVAAKPLILTA